VWTPRTPSNGQCIDSFDMNDNSDLERGNYCVWISLSLNLGVIFKDPWRTRVKRTNCVDAPHT